MYFYLVVFSLAIVLAAISELLKKANNTVVNNNQKKNQLLVSNVFLFLSGTVFVLVAGLRFNVGIDYAVYRRLQIPSVLQGYPTNMEYAYQLLIKFSNLFGNIQWVFFFTHLLIIGFIYLAIKRNSESYSLSVFILATSAFFTVSLNIMRECIAAAIFIFAVEYIVKRDKRFFGYSVLSFLFHRSSIIFLPLYFLNKIKLSKSMMFLLPFIPILGGDSVRKLAFYVSEHLGSYAKYFGSRYDRVSQLDKSFINIYWLCSVLVLYFSIIFINKSDEKQLTEFEIQKKNVYQNLQLLIVLFSGFSRDIPHGDRIIYLLFGLQILTIPFFFSIASRIKGSPFKHRQIMLSLSKMIIIIAFLLFGWRMIVDGNYGYSIPYHSIFD
ncbi:MAG: EpsG family protein [Streptococcaceae bacterium]|nr:EpsG family protein [Streptococcaceae bacterium]